MHVKATQHVGALNCFSLCLILYPKYTSSSLVLLPVPQKEICCNPTLCHNASHKSTTIKDTSSQSPTQETESKGLKKKPLGHTSRFTPIDANLQKQWRLNNVNFLFLPEMMHSSESQKRNTPNGRSMRGGTVHYGPSAARRSSGPGERKNDENGKKRGAGEGVKVRCCVFVVNYLFGCNGTGKTLRIDRNIDPRCYLRLKTRRYE